LSTGAMSNNASFAIRRLSQNDSAAAARLFAVMAEVFEEHSETLDSEYVSGLLARRDFWALAASEGDEILGGLTAHTLPMTRCEASELFIFDLAVKSEHRRKGVGRALVASLRALAAEEGIDVVFVPANNEDSEALDFYRAVGGAPESVTIFTFFGERA